MPKNPSHTFELPEEIRFDVTHHDPTDLPENGSWPPKIPLPTEVRVIYKEYKAKLKLLER